MIYLLSYETDPCPPPSPIPPEEGVGEYVPILQREEILREKKEYETLLFSRSHERGEMNKDDRKKRGVSFHLFPIRLFFWLPSSEIVAGRHSSYFSSLQYRSRRQEWGEK